MTPSQAVEFDLFRLDNIIDDLTRAGHDIDEHLGQLDQLVNRLNLLRNPKTP